QIKLDTESAHAQRRHNEERCAELITRSASSDLEMAQVNHRLTALQAEHDSNQQLLDSASTDLTPTKHDLATTQQDAVAAAGGLPHREQQQEKSRSEIFQAMAGATSLRNQLTQQKERLAAVDRETSRLETEMSGARPQVEGFGSHRGQL